MRRNLILLAATTFVTLIALEFLTRWVFADITTTSDAVSYFARRWLETVQAESNSLGFREDEFSADVPPDVFRIAVVGDSFTYGQGINAQDRMTNLLEKELSSGSQTFEVLNFGKRGANYPANTANVALAMSAAHPDYILLQWFVNDVDDPKARPRRWRLGGPLYYFLMPHSALYFLANNAWVQLQEEIFLLGSPNTPGTQERLDRLLDTTASSGRPYGMILWPGLPGSPELFALQNSYFDPVLETCARRHIVCVDLRPVLLSAPGDPERMVVNRFDAHPSAFANRLAADAALATFGEAWREGARLKRDQFDSLPLGLGKGRSDARS